MKKRPPPLRETNVEKPIRGPSLWSFTRLDLHVEASSFNTLDTSDDLKIERASQ